MDEHNQQAVTLQCPKCGTRGMVKASMIPPRGASFVCPKCQHHFYVSKKSLPLSPVSRLDARKETELGHALHTLATPPTTPSAEKTSKSIAQKTPVSYQKGSAEVKLCPYCGLFIKEADSQCIHCGRKQLQPPAEPAAMDHLPELIKEEDSRYRQNVRYLIELAFLVALLLALNVVYGPSGMPAGVTSTAVKDLIGVDSGEEYAQWVEEYRSHIAKLNRKILNDMSTLDHDKFTTPYIKRFKKEYLEYIFTTGRYRYSPYTPQQRVVAENPAQSVDVQVQRFEVGQRFIGPVDVSVFNSSPFPLFDIGINLVYEATKEPNRGRKIRGFLLIREPVSPGKLKIYMNLHHLQPVLSFEGVDKVSFYVTGIKVGKSGE